MAKNDKRAGDLLAALQRARPATPPVAAPAETVTAPPAVRGGKAVQFWLHEDDRRQIREVGGVSFQPGRAADRQFDCAGGFAGGAIGCAVGGGVSGGPIAGRALPAAKSGRVSRVGIYYRICRLCRLWSLRYACSWPRPPAGIWEARQFRRPDAERIPAGRAVGCFLSTS
jgi:hypothetical protein